MHTGNMRMHKSPHEPRGAKHHESEPKAVDFRFWKGLNLFFLRAEEKYEITDHNADCWKK